MQSFGPQYFVIFLFSGFLEVRKLGVEKRCMWILFAGNAMIIDNSVGHFISIVELFTGAPHDKFRMVILVRFVQ